MALTAEDRAALEARLAALQSARDALLTGATVTKVRYGDFEQGFSGGGADLGALTAEIDAIKRRLGTGGRRFARLSF